MGKENSKIGAINNKTTIPLIFILESKATCIPIIINNIRGIDVKCKK